MGIKYIGRKKDYLHVQGGRGEGGVVTQLLKNSIIRRGGFIIQKGVTHHREKMNLGRGRAVVKRGVIFEGEKGKGKCCELGFSQGGKKNAEQDWVGKLGATVKKHQLERTKGGLA